VELHLAIVNLPVFVSIHTCVGVKMMMYPKLKNVPSETKDFFRIRKTCDASKLGVR